MSYAKCHFNKSNLTARVGNIYKGYETLQCVQVTPFTKTVKELEGNLEDGYSYVTVDKLFDHYYVLLKNNLPFGLLIDPFDITYNYISSEIYPLNHPWKEVSEFITQLQCS